VERLSERADTSTPHAGDLSNPAADTALILGITSFALIPVAVVLLWVRLGDVQLDTWTVILYLISLLAAICASLFGVQGRRFAKEGAPGRVTATFGLVLGLGYIVVTVLGGIVWLSVFANTISHDL
jgi:hypothetical protein